MMEYMGHLPGWAHARNQGPRRNPKPKSQVRSTCFLVCPHIHPSRRLIHQHPSPGTRPYPVSCASHIPITPTFHLPSRSQTTQQQRGLIARRGDDRHDTFLPSLPTPPATIPGDGRR